MRIGFWSCLVLAPPFAVMGLLFGIYRERAARFISGFNTLPEEEQVRYDKAWMVRDIRNSCFLWALIMALGAAACLLVTDWCAVPAYVLWLILFFRDVHFDPHKAFSKYRIS